VTKEIAAPATTHMTGTNQRLDPTLTASFRKRTTEGYPPSSRPNHLRSGQQRKAGKLLELLRTRWCGTRVFWVARSHDQVDLPFDPLRPRRVGVADISRSPGRRSSALWLEVCLESLLPGAPPQRDRSRRTGATQARPSGPSSEQVPTGRRRQACGRGARRRVRRSWTTRAAPAARTITPQDIGLP
jgi:hypothetical protein